MTVQGRGGIESVSMLQRRTERRSGGARCTAGVGGGWVYDRPLGEGLRGVMKEELV